MRFRRTLLDRLERDILDDSRPLAPILRQVVALGGQTHSETLRKWALRELQGYTGTEIPLPEYRRVVAPLVMDGLTGGYQFQRIPVSSFDLPDFAREDLGDEVRLQNGVGEIEALRARSDGAVQLCPPMAADLAVFMSQGSQRQIVQLYWLVDVAALEGVLDQVRTRLIQLVAELRATMPSGQHEPTPEQVAKAVQSINIVTGDNSPVTVTAPFAVAQRGSSARALAAPVSERSWPVRWGIAAATAAMVAVLVSAWVAWL